MSFIVSIVLVSLIIICAGLMVFFHFKNESRRNLNYKLWEYKKSLRVDNSKFKYSNNNRWTRSFRYAFTASIMCLALFIPVTAEKVDENLNFGVMNNVGDATIDSLVKNSKNNLDMQFNISKRLSNLLFTTNGNEATNEEKKDAINSPSLKLTYSPNLEYKGTMNIDGVVEADNVVLNGGYIYQLEKDGVKISSPDGSNLKTISFKELTFIASEIYVSDNNIAVVGGYYEKFDETKGKDVSCNSTDFDSSVCSLKSSEVKVYDKKKGSLSLGYQIKGVIKETIMVDGYLYMVTSESVTNADLSNYQPSFKTTIDGLVFDNKIDITNIHYFNGVPTYLLTTITGIEVDNYTNINHSTYLGNVNNVFVDENSIYLASPLTKLELGVVKTKTHIAKFDYVEGHSNVKFAGQVVVDGNVEGNGFHKYGEHLSVLTTDVNKDDRKVYAYLLEQNEKLERLDVVEQVDFKVEKEKEVEKVHYYENLISVLFNDTTVSEITLNDGMEVVENVVGKTHTHKLYNGQTIELKYSFEDNKINGLLINLLDENGNELDGLFLENDESNNYSELIEQPRHHFVDESGLFGLLVKDSYVDSYKVYSIKNDSIILEHDIVHELINEETGAGSFENIVRGIYRNGSLYTISSKSIQSVKLN